MKTIFYATAFALAFASEVMAKQSYIEVGCIKMLVTDDVQADVDRIAMLKEWALQNCWMYTS